MFNKAKNKDSFTILELLIIISVLAILIGIGIPKFRGMQNVAQLVQVKKELQTLQAATESYYVNRKPNAYPGVAGDDISTSIQSTYLVPARPQIVSAVLKDSFDSENGEYIYQLSSNGKYYVWFSVGFNGEYAGCFMPGTKVLKEDGSPIDIEKLKIGELLLGYQKEHNRVLKIKKLKKLKRKIYSFNKGEYFVTEDHPFLTLDGWKSINPELSKKQYRNLHITKLAIGDWLISKNGEVILKSIDFKSIDNSEVYSIELTGNHTFYADGYVVHNSVAFDATGILYINDSGNVAKSGDDICITNGSGC